MIKDENIRIYVISNIHPSRHPYIDSVCSRFDSRFLIFKPHLDNEYNKDNAKIEFCVFQRDKEELDKSDISLVLMPLYGRDCASEIGYSQAMGKAVISYVQKMGTRQERDWLNDWMVKGFLDYIITSDYFTYQLLSSNPLIKQKTAYESRFGRKAMVHKIDNLEDLSDLCESLLVEKIISKRNFFFQNQ